MFRLWVLNDVGIALFVLFPLVLMFIWAFLEGRIEGSKDKNGNVCEETSSGGKFCLLLMLVIFVLICLLPFLKG